MSNVITLKPRQPISLQSRQFRLIAGFAQHRRQHDDVFWLKENAELLGILSATGAKVPREALAPFETFYTQIEERLKFFPQYYRFLVSICLDLEDLGMTGEMGVGLCDWAAKAGLAEAELSDLQRAEARRLLARRGAGFAGSDALDARLHRFIERSDTFALPNKKAAYELTHIVFYLSEYGARDPQISTKAVISLEYAGLLAYLDQNIDLLAEVCAALRFAGQVPSAIWTDAVQAAHSCFICTANTDATLNDAYHEYLVAGWASEIAGGVAFTGDLPEGSLRFTRSTESSGALRTMSERMFELGSQRSGDWQHMREQVAPYLAPADHDVLAGAEQSTDKFDAFFHGFARAGVI